MTVLSTCTLFLSLHALQRGGFQRAHGRGAGGVRAPRRGQVHIHVPSRGGPFQRAVLPHWEPLRRVPDAHVLRLGGGAGGHKSA